MKKLGRFAVAGVGVLAALQLVRPSIPVRPVAREIAAPPGVRQILNKDCSSCHSDERRLKWFDEVVPAYWLVRHDVLTGREHLDFSTLGLKPPAAQRATLFEAVNMIQLGAMPLPQFVQLHPEARVTTEELAILKNYLAPWGPLQPQPPAARHGATNLDSVQPEWNGVAFDPALLQWSLLSVTDRGDNNTFRFILGNDVAMKAIAAGTISPWPDGTKFAKIAWQQTPGDDGLVMPGSFVQVELMVKDAKRFKRTEGWGWGRWRGPNLQRYGSDPGFVNECTGCHRPLGGNDFVYTLPIAEIPAPDNAPIPSELTNSRAATIGGKQLLPHLRPLTLFTDRKALTISVLFGNATAADVLQGRLPRNGTKLPAGAELELVTWRERDDPHWFGARIPDTPVSVETLRGAADGGESVYERLDGDGAPVNSLPEEYVNQRKAFLLNLNLAP